MSELQKRIDEETKSVKWYDIFTPEEREEFIRLREIGEIEKADALLKMAIKRGHSYPI